MVRARSMSMVVIVLVAVLAGAGALAPTRASAAPGAVTTRVTHTVQAGESAFGIAQRYGVAVGDLLRANALRSTSVIQPGQRLVVPGVVLPTVLPPRLPADVRNLPVRLRLLPVFQAEAARARVPADLLMGLAYTESGWRSTARSPDGAIGIGQLLPATAHWVARDLLGQPKLDPAVPEDNIRLSARFLRYLLDQYPRSTRLALAAYFEGTLTVARSGPSRGAQRYARIVLLTRSWFAF